MAATHHLIASPAHSPSLPSLASLPRSARLHAGPCAAGQSGATCRQLAAGCGANLHDIAGKANGGDGNPIVGEPSDSWGDQTCGQWEIESGRCNLCTQPLWCDDPGNPFGYGGRINTPQKWIDEFFNKDGGRAFGARQCKWKPSQVTRRPRSFCLKPLPNRGPLSPPLPSPPLASPRLPSPT